MFSLKKPESVISEYRTIRAGKKKLLMACREYTALQGEA